MQFDLSKIIQKHGIVSVEPLTKGWSRDKKYVLTNENGTKYLLRVSSVDLLEKKQKQFELLNRIGSLNLECSRPVEFGFIDENNIYTLLSWLDGVSAEESIQNYSNIDAYKMGLEAGIALKKLHQIPFETQKESWYERYLPKAERKIKALENCEYKLDNQEFLIDYYRKNLHLMKDRPLTFCHGDYHLGNMIINNGKIGIIDFDKNNVADFLDDFKPYNWNVFKSEYFETGLIDGYFDNKIPDNFFELLKFYTVESCISHLPWAVQFGEREIKTSYKTVESCNAWWDNYKLNKPTWYKKI